MNLNKPLSILMIMILHLILFSSCDMATEEEKTTPSEDAENTSMETAHNRSVWEQKEVLSFDMVLYFGGRERLRGNVLMQTNFEKIRIRTADSVDMYWVDNAAYIYPESDRYPSPRFDLLTWPYFLAVPFKLSDPGTQLERIDSMSMGGEKFPAVKLSFMDGVGDSPEDWYKIMRDPVTGLMKAMVYIVTYSKSQEKAEEDPHAIVYDDVVEVAGVKMPSEWSFYNWREGDLEKKLGEASLSNFAFLEAEPQMFALPEGAVEVEK